MKLVRCTLCAGVFPRITMMPMSRGEMYMCIVAARCNAYVSLFNLQYLMSYGDPFIIWHPEACSCHACQYFRDHPNPEML